HWDSGAGRSVGRGAARRRLVPGAPAADPRRSLARSTDRNPASLCGMIFRRLLGVLRPYRGQVVASVLLAIASQICALAIPYLTGRSIDAATDGNRTLLLELAGLIVAMGAIKGVLMFFRRWLAGRLSLAVEFDLRNRMYTHLQRLSYGFFDRHQTGQLMSRATVDLQAVRFFLGYGLIFFFQHVLTIVGVTAIMLWTDWRLALVALAITPFVVVLAYRYSKVSHPVLREVQQKMADVATVAEENIVGVHVVKSFAQEDQEQAKFQQRSNAVFEQTVLANRQRSLYVPLLSFVPLLAQAA